MPVEGQEVLPADAPVDRSRASWAPIDRATGREDQNEKLNDEYLKPWPRGSKEGEMIRDYRERGLNDDQIRKQFYRYRKPGTFGID